MTSNAFAKFLTMKQKVELSEQKWDPEDRITRQLLRLVAELLE